MRNKETLTLALLIQATIANAVEMTFTKLNSPELVSCGSIMCMKEDHHGYLWIGTQNGLCCYDGYEMKKVDEQRMATLHNGKLTVISLQEDARHNLWVETYAGYQLYDSNRRWQTPEAALQTLGIQVKKSTYKLYVNREGNLCVLTDDSLHYYNYARENTLSTPLPAQQNIKHHLCDVQTSADCLYLLAGKRLWTLNLTYADWASEELPALILPAFGDEEISTLQTKCYVDEQGGIWIFSLFSEGIIHHAPGQSGWEKITLPQNDQADIKQEINRRQNDIRNICQSPDGMLWIGTNHRGLFRYNPHTKVCEWVQRQNSTHVNENTLNNILADSHGTLWLGYYKAGIDYILPKQQTQRNASDCGDVTVMQTCDDGSLWIGTDGNGLWHESQNRSKLKQILPYLTITDIKYDTRNRCLWVGSYDQGIYHIDQNQNVTHLCAENGQLPHNFVQRICVDRLGKLWVCSNFSNSYCYNPTTRTFRTLGNQQIPDVTGVSLIYDTRFDRILLGTYYGIWCQDIEAEDGELITGARDGNLPMSEAQILCMMTDTRDSLLWLGHRQGLTIWDAAADTLYDIGRSDGLNNNQIQTIQKDSSGNTWVSMMDGIALVKCSRSKDGRYTFSIRNFSDRSSFETFGYNLNAASISLDGKLLYGTTEGYVTYDIRELLNTTTSTPTPQITSLATAGKNYTLARNLRLGANDQPLTVSFYTGNPLDAGHVRYSYRVKEVQDSWTVTTENRVSLLSLPSGDNHLQVRASLQNGEWSNIETLNIHVDPPTWRSPWMLATYLLLSIVALGSFILLMRRKQKNKEEHMKRELEKEHQAQLTEAKLQFFTNVSHDLRTPLTLILSPLEQLRNEPLSDKAQRQMEIVNRNAQQLLTQISALLDFRKLDVGAEKLRLSQLQDLCTFVQQQCDAFHHLGQDRDIRFELLCESQPINLCFDEDKMRRIVYNLLSNAFKYSPNHSIVKLTIKQSDGVCRIEVSDQGPGIIDSEKQRIFERFYQSETEDPKPGNGVGLHIASQYVSMHGGKLWVEDNKPQGARFCIELPVNLVENTASESHNTIPSSSDTIAEGQDNERFCILIVDDNSDLRQFVRDSLGDIYNIITAADGIEALDILQRETVHLIVTDVMMPRMNGLELCNRIKSTMEWSHIPVLMLTAKTAEQSEIEGLKQGADDYLTKPFSIDKLRLRIDKFIEWANRSHRQFDEQRHETPIEAITHNKLDADLMQRAIELVEKHLAEADFGVDQLSSELCMSRSNLYKKMMALTGKSPIEFIRAIRMSHASQMLRRHVMQVSEIAYSVGYNTQKTFTENFKQEYGITPTEYARTHSD